MNLLTFLLVKLISSYQPLSYSEITSRFKSLSESCPFLTIFSAQEKYNLPYPKDCDGCYHLVAVITNSNSSSAPHVYFSGCLHGDERLGPVVVTELAEYLCTEYHTDSWVKRLVDTRVIIMTPTTNAEGYYHDRREEKFMGKYLDPNRDFPYNNPYACFETVAAQVIGKVFDEYLIRIGITFHGGEKSLTYQWGSYNHMTGVLSTEAPDLQALKSISKAIATYSGSHIRTGAMTDIVYPVNGGLEDWAYGGGWDSSGASDCASFKTTNLEGLKQLLFLVETFDDKEPSQSQYGKKSEVKSEGGGLVPQYLRMSLSLIDLVEPYILVNKLFEENGFVLEWEVWGCTDLAFTQVYYSDNVDSDNKDWTQWKKSQKLLGDCRWRGHSKFSLEFTTNKLLVVIVAVVDQWTTQINPDPKTDPVSHVVRSRTISNYKVSHNGYEILGNDFVATKILRPFDRS